MSFARKPVSRTDMFISCIVIGPDGPFPIGSAVAVVYRDGNRVYQLAGAYTADGADSFFGFLSGTFSPGSPASVTTVRGAIVVPQVEDDVPLIPDQPVYLSLIPGKVTQSVPLAPSSQIVRVGSAISTTQIVLLTDSRIDNPG